MNNFSTGNHLLEYLGPILQKNFPLRKNLQLVQKQRNVLKKKYFGRILRHRRERITFLEAEQDFIEHFSVLYIFFGVVVDVR